MKKGIGIRFEYLGPIYYYHSPSFELNVGDDVLIERNGLIEVGSVVCFKDDLQEDDFLESSVAFKRLLTEKDLKQVSRNAEEVVEIFSVTKQIVLEQNLDMKILKVAYTFDRDRLLIQFSAEKRIDFRQLVRDLAGRYHTRIELRQIGVRDEAKIIGGIGPCGRPLCCSSFLGDFTPVSIKMAKDQNLSLNPTKISGLCGRLMCCLSYENEVYESARKKMPDYGQFIDTPDGSGKVVGLNLLQMVVTVRLTNEDRSVELYYGGEEPQLV